MPASRLAASTRRPRRPRLVPCFATLCQCVTNNSTSLSFFRPTRVFQVDATYASEYFGAIFSYSTVYAYFLNFFELWLKGFARIKDVAY